MEINDDNIEILRRALSQTLSTDNARRREAEEFLEDSQKTPGYLTLLLHTLGLLSGPSGSDGKLAMATRQAASIQVKNTVDKHWVVLDEHNDEVYSIINEEKDIVKEQIVDILSSCPLDCQELIAEAVANIGKHDYHTNWMDLAVQIAAKLSSNDFGAAFGCLCAINSLFKKYRYSVPSDELFLEIIHSITHIGPVLLSFMTYTTEMLTSSPSSSSELQSALSCLRLSLRVFYSLNYQDFADYFVSKKSEFFDIFRQILTIEDNFEQQLEPRREGDNRPGPMDAVHEAVVDILILFAQKYEEDVGEYMNDSSSLVWRLLMKIDKQPRYDQFAIAGMRFLSCLVSRVQYKELFSSDGALSSIIEHVVFTNMTISQQDEECFSDNPIEFIRKDMEGSDSETRRRCAIDLIRCMCKHFETQATNICGALIENLLNQYTSSSGGEDRYKMMDVVINMMLAVAIKSYNPVNGNCEINKDSEVYEFYRSNIVPLLQHDDALSAGQVLLQSQAIKFMTMIRSILPSDIMVDVIKILVRHLKSEHVIVQTYAAFTIEKFLLLSDKNSDSGVTVARLNRDHLSDCIEELFSGLFSVLNAPDLPENEYVMKATMRVMSTIGDEIESVVEYVLDQLSSFLSRACANPRNPGYNHYLFESLAILVSSAIKANGKNYDKLEEYLFPKFDEILQSDIVEFVPYVFQLLTLLLELKPSDHGGNALSDAYAGLLPVVVSPLVWESKGNVPALVDLIIAYLRKDSRTVESSGKLLPILGVFQKLLSIPLHVESCFKLLMTICQHVSIEATRPHLQQVFWLLCKRLEQAKASKSKASCNHYVQYMIAFFNFGIVTYGIDVLETESDGVQHGLFQMILHQVWLNKWGEFVGMPSFLARIVLIGIGKLLCEGSVCSDDALWLELLECGIACAADVSSHSKSHTLTAVAEADDDESKASFENEYNKLNFCRLPGWSAVFPDRVGSEKKEFVGIVQEALRDGHMANLVRRRLPKLSGDALVELANELSLQLDI